MSRVILPTSKPIGKVFAPRTNNLNKLAFVQESFEAVMFSAGILLTDPMPRLTTITASDVAL